jgi:hypothetical protein
MVCLATFGFQANALAVTQTIGVGSAVSAIQGTAEFESSVALSVNPYLEGGMSFSRTNMADNNGGCGYAGTYCGSPPGFTGFSGNYMYGPGYGGYFDIKTTGGRLFSGLEFVAGTGFSSSPDTIYWEAFKSNVSVGSGVARISLNGGVTIGFSDASGFDQLRFSDIDYKTGNYVAAAFDTVHAQYTTPAPEPETYAMLLAGLGLMGAVARRKQK